MVSGSGLWIGSELAGESMGINFLEPLMLDSLESIMWPFCRIAGFFMSAMAFSGAAVPQIGRAHV